MKQTAVQFLKYEMNQMFLTGTLSPIKMKYIIEQALEMEKEQIVNSWDDGFSNGFDLGKYDDDCKHDDGEQYYNETFKSE